MKIEVVCYSMTGKTRKVAEAIAQELGAEVKTPEKATGECDILFLGSGNYGKKCGKTMEEFIGRLKPSKYLDIYLFATWGGGRDVLGQMTSLLEKKGLVVSGRWGCPGSFLFIINWGRPNKKDLDEAREFARKAVPGAKPKV